MPPKEVFYTNDFKKSFSKLQPHAKIEAEEVIKKNIENPLIGEPKHGSLKGCRGMRFGHNPEYRIIYRFKNNELIFGFLNTREAMNNLYKLSKKRIFF